MNYPYINIKVNGVAYKLLVDTGSNKTFIFKFKRSFAKFKFYTKKWIRFRTFLLPAVQKKMLIDFGVARFSFNILTVDWQKYLEYAANLPRNLQVYMFFQNFGYDGILGIDILSKLTLKIDCKKGKSSVIRGLKRDVYDVLPLKNYRDHILTTIFLNNRKKNAIIDTGINISDLIFKRKTGNLQFMNKKYALFWNIKKPVAIYKFNGAVQFTADVGRCYRLGSANLNRTFNNIKVSIANVMEKNNPIVTYSFLKRFGVVIFDKNELLYVLRNRK